MGIGVIVLEDRLIVCDVCEGRGWTMVGPQVWDMMDLMFLSKSDFELEECDGCSGSGWEDVEEIEVFYE